GYGEGVSMIGQFVTQAVAVGVTLVWTGVISWILFKVVGAITGLRVSEEIERHGLDEMLHGETAYHG
ncbi:MAG: ammonium transporter, partial [Gammaproteobacteria bacterium]|nr:ammonium transporter [Gammaproteobacteria bacterium]